MPAAAPVNLTAPQPDASQKQPITSKWWFWTAIGAAVAGGLVALYLAERTPSPPGCPTAMGYVCPDDVGGARDIQVAALAGPGGAGAGRGRLSEGGTAAAARRALVGELSTTVSALRFSATGWKTRSVAGVLGPGGLLFGYYGPSGSGPVTVTVEAIDARSCVVGTGSATVQDTSSGQTAPATVIYVRPLPDAMCVLPERASMPAPQATPRPAATVARMQTVARTPRGARLTPKPVGM